MTPLTPAALAEIEQRAREAAALTTDKKMTYKQKLWAQSLATPALAADVATLLARLREVEAELVERDSGWTLIGEPFRKAGE